MNALKLQVKPRLLLGLTDAAGTAHEYTVEYPLSAVVQAEQSVGRSLKSLAEWFDLQWTDIAPVLHAGLLKHHPDTKVEDIWAICEDLGAEGVLEIRHAIICLNFPGTMEKIQSRISQRAGSPNVPSGAVQ